MASRWTAIDLFSGAGGLTRGLHEAGWGTVLAVEVDANISATYAQNFPDVKLIRQDIAQVSFEGLRGKVRLVAGGPPCQPFSVAGHQRAAFDPRDGIPHYARAVEEILPDAFLIENVAGLAARRHNQYLFAVVSKLERLGYHVAFDVMDAADYGVPQHRRRLFVVGIRHQTFEFPEPTHGPKVGKPYVTAREALKSAPIDLPNTAIVTYAKKPVLRPQPFDGMLVNGGGRPINLDEPCQTIPASAGGNRTHIVDECGFLSEYHAYLMDGGEPRSGVVKGVRRLTVNESARIQSFPDQHAFLGTQSSRYRQVGNAVPPVLARAVGAALLRQLSTGVAEEVATGVMQDDELMLQAF